jgi:hypothetical protein
LKAEHLSYETKINLGGFYTPKHIADRLYETLAAFAPPDKTDAMLEPNCGYGALLNHSYAKAVKKVVGADIDNLALKIAKASYNNIAFYQINALKNISRSSYGIKTDDRLLIVANPPYNDLTSQVKNGAKKIACESDGDIQARDLGLSSLLAFNKLRPDVLALLHPLSYLIKKINFNRLKPFMKNYALKEAIVFNSQEFFDTLKTSGFPVLIAIYQKSDQATSYKDIYNRSFVTIEGESFSLSQFDYIGSYIDKYPNKRAPQNHGGHLFYTMRDINALKRSKTFIKERIANAVCVADEKLDYYCYADIFKDYAHKLPYYMGNLDIPIDRDCFGPLRESFRALSVAKHGDIFAGKIEPPAPEFIQRAKTDASRYFNDLFGVKKTRPPHNFNDREVVALRKKHNAALPTARLCVRSVRSQRETLKDRL